MKIATLYFFLFFLFLNLVSSQLSPTQNSTMINLSKLLHSQVPLPWDVTKNPCNWKGVTCSTGATSVTKLSLSNLKLTNSSFLPLACQLDSLEVLDVSKNLLTSIPDEFFRSCGAILTLKSMNFSWNQVSGPLPSFGNGFTSLESLDLSQNSISGIISLQLNALVSLKSLNLSANGFTGSIPISIGKFKGLEQLQLSANNFSGNILQEFGDFANLTVLDLSFNNLQGSIPYKIAQHPRLEVLVVSGNMLSGEVPSNLSRSINRFAASQNNLQGGIPSGISQFLNNLDLSYNNLDGFIANDLLSQPNLRTVDLSYNKLTGKIPEVLSSSLVRLRLGGNSLQGSISAINFVVLQNLAYLELDNNLLNGKIPSAIGSCQNLSLLNLARNQLSGELPTELGKLKKLQGLSLQLNNFVGKFPLEITQLSRLTILNISWNSLSGSIPPSISNLGFLEYLHLQENNFSGSIPGNIGNVNNLIELQLGNNHLSGRIPPMPRNLQYSLNISNNLFEEQIPETLAQMSQLEILDLSNNNFSGEIPKFLTGMRSLTLLLLENNSLSGIVPQFDNNVKLDAKGNPGLIFLSPVGPNTSQPHKKKQVGVKIAVVISAAIFGGLIAILGIFLSKRLLYKVHDIEVQIQSKHPKSPVPEAIESRILTTNTAHRSNIDFSKAMEAVSNPLNLVLKTKFSTYYKAVMPSGVNYFVKKLNCTDRIFQPSSQGSFGQELEALGKVNSSNIMTPLAYALAGDNAYLIYEMAFKKTLFDVLHRSSGAPLDWVSRCSIAVGIAQGLASLHGYSSGPILLFDLTSKTIMLKTLKEPQIGDIELCKVIDPSKSTSSLSAVAGSVGYVPPEYAYTMRVTLAGNVYSFGVILLELLTGKQAVSEGTELARWVLRNSSQPQKWDRILDFRISRTSPSVRSQMLAVLKIALACINASSEARPKMKSVLRMLLNAR